MEPNKDRCKILASMKLVESDIMKKSLTLGCSIVFCLLLANELGVVAQTRPIPSASIAMPGPPPVAVTETVGTPLAKPLAVKIPSANSGLPLPTEKTVAVRLKRFDKPPVIDGRLDDEVWKSAAVFKDFFQISPGDNTSPSKETEVFVGYDTNTFYIGFRAHDEAGKVRATVARRDAVSDDDNVSVYLDTYNDQRRAYALFFNPLGVQADAIYTEGGGLDYSFDVVMESKGVLTQDGYTVEVAIPFKSLRYRAGRKELWGIHVRRVIKRFNDELSSWMPLSRDRSGFLNQEGHLTGLDGLANRRTLEIIPSLTLSETGKRVRSLVPPLPQGRFVNEPIGMNPGLNVKVGITPTVTLDLAINPDFAQVEADQLVVTANQRFPIFFAERRPFFLEGIDIFQTPLTPVHTRAIVDPDLAVKLTGKHGRYSFGLLLASDNGPGTFIGDERLDPRNLRFLDKNAYVGVLRVKRDIGKQSSIGIVATTYNFIEKHNNLGGVDGRFRLDEKTTVNFQLLGSTSRNFFRDPVLGRSLYRTGNGFSYEASYNKTARNFGVELYGEGRTRDYRADVGFTFRTNTNYESALFRYSSTPNPKARLTSWRLYNLSHIDFDFQGRMQIWETETNFQVNLRHQTFFSIAYERAYERLFEEEFGNVRTLTRSGAFIGPDNERSSNKNHFFLSAGSQLNKKFSFSLRANYRQGNFDFDFGAPPKFPRVSPAALLNQTAKLDPGRGGLIELRGSFIFQATNALRTTIDITKNRLRRYDTDRIAFDVNLISWRTTYQFTRFIFARARVDYESLPSRARGQFILGWTPNPGTAFYVGYNEDVNRNGFNPFTGLLEPGIHRNGRTFFIKMSYLFRRNL